MSDNELILEKATEKARERSIPVPVYKNSTRYEKTVLFMSDLHIPYHDEEALGTAIEYGMSKDPDCAIISELPDFYKLSYWSKDPNRMDFFEELSLSRDCVRMLSKTFKGMEKVYIVGNHDERLKMYLWKKAEELTKLEELALPNLLEFSKHDWRYVDNRQRMVRRLPPLKIGHLTFLHGHEIKTGWGAVNLAKIYYERARGNVVLGHHHRAQEWIVRTISGRHEGCWLIGGLCKLSPEFLPHNDWIHGFAVIRFDADGDFKVKNHKIINGKVL